MEVSHQCWLFNFRGYMCLAGLSFDGGGFLFILSIAYMSYVYIGLYLCTNVVAKINILTFALVNTKEIAAPDLL